ncbi:hypothetical protein PBY51_015633 [Eleginops maclovinus]|uniref:Uncharacterized protein n=1 Tax=Eleginops maclovinus TaxID=56733 RepID=A0AAN8ARB4_ELEMC|nr:hypothetical protein PBY51_015633 [Eleginops maclovinus]
MKTKFIKSPSEFHGLTRLSSPRCKIKWHFSSERYLHLFLRGAHSLICRSDVATGDQPHPEATCDYAINELFNSHYFIVIKDERGAGEVRRSRR